MSVDKPFFDTNVLLYLFSEDPAKAGRAEQLLIAGGVISVQVLNEFASVATRKLSMSVPEVREALLALRSICTVLPLTVKVHERGLELAERYGFSIYDSMILSAALEAKCRVVLSEDFQNRQVVEERLEIENPFATRS